MKTENTMQIFLDEFSSVSKSDWIKKIEKDLKGKPLSDIHFNDPIEEIDFVAYAHKTDLVEPKDSITVKRGLRATNEWEIVSVLPKVSPLEMNKLALHYLMTGTTNLRIDLDGKSATDWNIITKGIQFKYISATVIYYSKEQLEIIKHSLGENCTNCSLIPASNDLPVINSVRNFLVDGTQVQRCGGNTAQEIAFVLHEGHIKLVELLQSGHTLRDSQKQLKFRFGVGNDYIISTVKFRVFRLLWHKIVVLYGTDFQLPHIEAEIGHLNKSLSDPHTNLLRQTTEAMSAIAGGVQELTILPHNWRAKNADISKTQRLATNISLILKEEAYLDAVVDPAGGSYTLEKLTHLLAEKSWALLQELSSSEVAVGLMTTKIAEIKVKRIAAHSNSERTLIGVNKYFNPESDKVTEVWDVPDKLLFGEELILERDYPTK